MSEKSSSATAFAGFEPEAFDAARRFGGIARLYGQKALERLQRAHVCVIGVGGVGSWTVEALARSAVGQLTLIDMDHVSESNINRQVQALEATLGQAKVAALAERIGQINPACLVHAQDEFVDAENVARLLGTERFDYVVDASDQVKAKVAIVAYCHHAALKLVCVGAAGGQRDPTRVRVADLAHTQHEPLLARVRKKLRAEHGFSRNIKVAFGVRAVFSEEPLVYPVVQGAGNALAVAGTGGVGQAIPQGAAEPAAIDFAAGLNCAGFGSSVAVTAVFGMVAAGEVLAGVTRGA